MRSATSTSNPTSLSGFAGSASTNGAPPSGSPAQRSSRGGCAPAACDITSPRARRLPTARLLIANLFFLAVQLHDVDAVRRLAEQMPAEIIGADPVEVRAAIGVA